MQMYKSPSFLAELDSEQVHIDFMQWYNTTRHFTRDSKATDLDKYHYYKLMAEQLQTGAATRMDCAKLEANRKLACELASLLQVVRCVRTISCNLSQARGAVTMDRRSRVLRESEARGACGNAGAAMMVRVM